jgi:putative heme-binding domain-containing protein
MTRGWTPELRERYFSWFGRAGAYKGGHSFGKFLVQIKDEAMKHVPEDQRQAMAAAAEAKKASEQTQAAVAAPRQFVKNYTMKDLQAAISKPLKGRNFERGRAMYTTATCAACHRFGGAGGAIGPDLTGVGGRMGPPDILESIIEPSKVISDQYEAVLFTLKNGQVIMGRIVNLAGDSLRVNTNMLDPSAITSIKQSDIATQMVSPASLMPPGLINTLTEEEILDLLAYMISGGNPQDAMFR